jgi:hypothetical protein
MHISQKQNSLVRILGIASVQKFIVARVSPHNPIRKQEHY